MGRSKFIKERLTKKVYYDSYWWSVKKMVKPNKNQDFLWLERVDISTAFDDGTSPIEYVILDIHNSEIGLDNKNTHEFIKTDSIKKQEELKKKMTADWMRLFKYDYIQKESLV